MNNSFPARFYSLIQKNLLNSGISTVTAAIFSPPQIPNSLTNLVAEQALSFEIVDELRGSGARGNFPGEGWEAYAVRPFIKSTTIVLGKDKYEKNE